VTDECSRRGAYGPLRSAGVIADASLPHFCSKA
jgi:hypothetical protein